MEDPPITPGPCPVCGTSDRLRELQTYKNKSRAVVPTKILTLVGCERCGLVHSHPLPTEAQLEAYYGEPEGWESRMASEPGVDEEAERARKIAVKRDRYERERRLLEPYLGELPERRRVLDFGCGLGTWLDVLQDAGWETWGLEPGPRQRDFAAQRHQMVDDPPAEPTFDLVVINHVVEHLRDPRAVLGRLGASVKPGGHLFVSVPDLGRLGEHGKYNYVKSERHICSYTSSAMGSLLGLTGFAPVQHFIQPEWDALAEAEQWRLKMLGRRTGEVVDPSGEPLQEALDALALYAERKADFDAAKRARKAGAAAEPVGRSRALLRAIRARISG